MRRKKTQFDTIHKPRIYRVKPIIDLRDVDALHKNQTWRDAVAINKYILQKITNRLVFGKHVFSVGVSVTLIISILMYSVSPSSAQILQLPATHCLGGWEHTSGAEGKTDVEYAYGQVYYTSGNSAVLKNRAAQIYCSGFLGSVVVDELPKRLILNFSLYVDSDGGDIYEDVSAEFVGIKKTTSTNKTKTIINNGESEADYIEAILDSTSSTTGLLVFDDEEDTATTSRATIRANTDDNVDNFATTSINGTETIKELIKSASTSSPNNFVQSATSTKSTTTTATTSSIDVKKIDLSASVNSKMLERSKRLPSMATSTVIQKKDTQNNFEPDVIPNTNDKTGTSTKQTGTQEGASTTYVDEDSTTKSVPEENTQKPETATSSKPVSFKFFNRVFDYIFAFVVPSAQATTTPIASSTSSTTSTGSTTATITENEVVISTKTTIEEPPKNDTKELTILKDDATNEQIADKATSTGLLSALTEQNSSSTDALLSADDDLTQNIDTQATTSKENPENPENTENGEITIAPSHTKETTDVSVNDLLYVSFTLDGYQWTKLGTIGLDNWKTASFELPVTQWDSFEHLQISLESAPAISAESAIYLDSMWIDVLYAKDLDDDDESLDDQMAAIIKLKRILLEKISFLRSRKTDFSAGELIEFEFDITGLDE